MPHSQAKDRLLNAAVEVALSQGIVDLSLRELAAAIGTSHRMLIYHFESREGLLVAVVREVERRERQALIDGTVPIAESRAWWLRLTDPALRPQERLFFEIYSHALRGRPGTEGFLDEAIGGWLGPVIDALAGAGVDQRAAPGLARLSMAVTRGLLLDLLATDDLAGTTEAFGLFAGLLEQAPLASGLGQPEQV